MLPVRMPYRFGCQLEENEEFWSKLEWSGIKCPQGVRVVIRVDFNGDVGEGNRDDEEVLVEAKEIRMMQRAHTGSGDR